MMLVACDKKSNENNPITVNTPEELTAALQEVYEGSEAPGFSVSIVKNDAVIYQNTFGKANIATEQPYTMQSVQPIGSISKTFVAAAIVKAIEQGHFDLETDINDVLPVDVINPNQPDATIKVKHLVTHTSSLGDNIEAYFAAYSIVPGEDLSTTGSQLLQQGFGLEQRAQMPLGEFLAEYYLEDGDWYSTDNFVDAVPGSQWGYSNIATSLAAYLVEAATGTPFSEYVLTNVLQPLGMSNSSYDFADFDQGQLAKLYWDKNTPLPLYTNDSYPDGSLMTNNEDMTKYLIDMMKGARGESTTLFSKESYQLLFEPILADGVLPSVFGDNQAVFWFTSGNLIKHDGSDPGVTTHLQFDKAENTGYVLLTNMDASSDDHEQNWAAFFAKVQQHLDAFVQSN